MVVNTFTPFLWPQVSKQLHVDESEPDEKDKGHEDYNKEACPISEDLEEEFLHGREEAEEAWETEGLGEDGEEWIILHSKK